MNELRKVGTIEATELLLGDVLYQRQVDIVANFASPNEFLNQGSVTWFIAIDNSWVFVGEEIQPELEAWWDRLQETGGNPFTADSDWTEEDRQDALCEQMASDDYETSVYG